LNRKINSSHPVWIVSNQFVLKAIMAAKFFISALFLGPDLMGVAGVLLVIYAIFESLTEFGLIQALIQSESKPSDDELNSIWWAIFIRGILLSILIFSAGLIYPNSDKLGEGFLTSICYLSISAILKSSNSPKLYIAQRQRNFKLIFLNNVCGSIIDIIISITLLRIGFGVESIFFSVLMNELTRLILSHYIFSREKEFIERIRNPKFDIRKFSSYGKWIWFNNLINLTLNQSDKMMTSLLLGTTSLGYYQMSNRLSQLGISDISVAFGQYLFPSFSRLSNESDKIKLLHKSFSYMLAFSIASSIFVFLNAHLVPVIIGHQWNESVILLKVLVFTMFNGSMISVLVAYFRAIGRPKLVTISAIFQLICFLPILYWLSVKYEVLGTAFSTTISTTICLLILFFNINNKFTMLSASISNFKCFYFSTFIVIVFHVVASNLYLDMFLSSINVLISLYIIFAREKIENNSN
jgi:polysaccharide transporter, PST family